VAFIQLRALGQKRAREAIALSRPADAAIARAGRPPGLRIASLRALAMAHRIDTDYVKQHKALEDALALAQATYGPDHVTTLDIMCRVAHALDDVREREQALQLAERCLAGRRRTLGDRHPAVGRGLHTLGIVQNGLQRRAEAEASYVQAIEILEESLGKADPMLANVYADLSTAQRRQKKVVEALASAEHALAIDRKTYGTSHVNVGLSLASTGHLKRDLQRYEDALVAYREANELFAKLLDAEHPYIGTTYASMGETYEYMKRYDDAIVMQERALAIQTKRPEHCAQPFMARVTLAEPLVLRGRPGDRVRALALLREARDGLTACGPKADRELNKLDHMLTSHRLSL
jgi:tetratricopeptide (TPR) repeat protein